MRIEIKKKEVLEAIEKHYPVATLPEIIQTLGKNQMFISGYLRALEHMGVVTSKKAGTSIVFTLKNEQTNKIQNKG